MTQPIYVRLRGGMGNQMFQYAAAYAAARRWDTTVSVDISELLRDRKRCYGLGLWKGVDKEPAEPWTVPDRVVREHTPSLWEPDFESRAMPGTVLSGYWQTEKYFLLYRPELLEVFTPRRGLEPSECRTLFRILRADQSVAVMVRRGDFVGNPHHGCLDTAYYRRALEHIETYRGDVDIFVFSDDPEWCLEHLDLGGREFTVAGTWDRSDATHLGREDADLELVRACRNVVCANSTYSWWGAWLGADWRGGIVVAPKAWLRDSDGLDTVPARWVRF